MEISGHRTRSVIDRYNIVSEDDLREAARKQEKHLACHGSVADVVSGEYVQGVAEEIARERSLGFSGEKSGTPGVIRTRDLRIRNADQAKVALLETPSKTEKNQTVQTDREEPLLGLGEAE